MKSFNSLNGAINTFEEVKTLIDNHLFQFLNWCD